MKIELYRKLLEVAYQKEIYFNISDTPDDLIVRILIALLQK